MEDTFRVHPTNNQYSKTSSTVQEVKVVCPSVQELLVLNVAIGRISP